MRRITYLIPMAIALVLATNGMAQTAAPAPKMVHVRCKIAVPSGVTESVTMMAQIYRLVRDNLGRYLPPTTTQNLIVSLEPGAAGTGSGQFDVDLEAGNEIEYEFKVVPLDPEGRERTDGRYYFVRGDSNGELYENTVSLRQGEVNEVVVNMRWITRDRQAKSNFLQVVPGKGSADYLLALYLNDPTNIDLTH